MEDGRTILYMRGTTVLEVDFSESEGRPIRGAPRELFSGPFHAYSHALQVGPGNDRFIVLRYGHENRPRLRVHRGLLRDAW